MDLPPRPRRLLPPPREIVELSDSAVRLLDDSVTELSLVDMEVAIPSIPLPTGVVAPAVADEPAPVVRVPTERLPRPSVPTGSHAVSRGMSDRMRAIEALSTVEPLSPCDSGVYAGESFADLRRPVVTPMRIGMISAVLSALAIGILHLATAQPASARPEVAQPEQPVVVHAPAVDQPAPAPAPIPSVEPDADKDSARRLALMGRRAMEQGRPATARRMFLQALEDNPRCRIALEGLGRDAMNRKRYGSAVQYFRAAVKVDPRNGDNQRLLAEAYAAQGRTDRARKQYERAAALGDTTAAKRLTELAPAADALAGE